MSDLSSAQKLLNRVKRRCDLIEENAKAAGGADAAWSMNHGHVVRYMRSVTKDGKLIYDHSYDVCQQPWGKQHTVVGINPHGREREDMRHIATCNPAFMTSVVTDMRELAAKAEKLDLIQKYSDDCSDPASTLDTVRYILKGGRLDENGRTVDG